MYKNKLILIKIKNLRLNLVNPLQNKKHVFASVASKNVLHMNAEQRAMCKCELNIMIIEDCNKKKGNRYDADDKDDDMNQLVKYARDKKKYN